MQTDKKIEEYLERAWKVAGIDTKGNWSELTRNRIVEIAKMIQLEEHREQIEITPEKDMLSFMRDNLDYHKTFAKHKVEIDEIETQRKNPL